MPKSADPRMLAPQCHSLVPVVSLHDNKWFSLKSRGGYFVLENYGHQVAVLPIVDNRSIVMVRVHRPVIVDTPLELPAGGTKDNESPLQAAARELAEETGIAVKELDRFSLQPSVAMSPSRNPVLPWIYELHITQQEFEQRGQHDAEVSGVESYTFAAVERMIAQGEIYVGFAIAVICRFLFDRNGREKGNF